MSEQQQQQQPPSLTKKQKTKKSPPANLIIPPKRPKLTKAERRAKQEAERAAKQTRTAAAKGGGGATVRGNDDDGTNKKKQQSSSSSGSKRCSGLEATQHHQSRQSKQQRALQQQQEGQKQAEETDRTKASEHTFAFSTFAHLPPYRDPLDHPEEFSGVVLGGSLSSSITTIDNNNNNDTNKLPPSVLSLGLLYARGILRGGNARCRAMLRVYMDLIAHYNPPPSAKGNLRPHLDTTILKPAFDYWTQHCRPHSVSMGNAFTFVKTAVASLERDIEVEDLRHVLRETIGAYMTERMEFADRAIATHVISSKIVDGDVLLVYGHSEVVVQVLLTQQRMEFPRKDFSVIVVDSRPLLEGRRTLHRLRQANIRCTYILLNAISYVMKDVTKVLLGASTLMTDGSLLGRVGTACIALSAHVSRKAVLVCCETYKISNRVQLESITGNELGDPKCVYDTLSNKNDDDDVSVLTRPNNKLRMLNLLYDLTPSNYISGIVTEMGIVPPTSVAVLLREMK